MAKRPSQESLSHHASFRFYAELNDFLHPQRRGERFTHRYAGRVSVKDMIESLGVPHTEVDLILVNGESVDFSRLVENGDIVSVYPVFEAIDISAVLRVRPEPLRTISFVVDVHLGGLARSLRMLGFDTHYERDSSDEELADLATRGRILLTKDRGLLKRNAVTHGYYVRSKDAMEQVLEVLRRFDLASHINPFVRCLHCNGMLRPVAKETIEHRLEAQTNRYYEEFALCSICDRVYWKGSHHAAMTRQVQSIREKLQPKDGRNEERLPDNSHLGR